MLADVLEDQLVLNRALPRTLGALLFRPGFLTAEYVRGRIVRYIAPFRLYLVASVLFFLVLSFVTIDALSSVTVNGEEMSIDEAVEAVSAEAALQARDSVPTTSPTDSLQARDNASSTSPADSLQTADSVPTTAATGLQPWARDIELSSSWPWMQRAMERKLAQVGHLPAGEAARAVGRDLLEFAPHMVFLLLPVFAFLLKLLYIRRDRYYAEHFVFALHVHAFVFVAFLLMFALPWWADLALVTWMALYVWLAMRRVYRQGWFRTTVKWWLLGWSYFFVFSFGIAGLAVATLLFT
jgi:hypothetical protein